MNIETLKTLASSSPPLLKGKVKFQNLGDANADNARLETELGVDRTEPQKSLLFANCRNAQLSQLLALSKAEGKSSSPAASPSPTARLSVIGAAMPAAPETVMPTSATDRCIQGAKPEARRKIEISKLSAQAAETTGTTRRMIESKIARLKTTL